MAELYLIIFHIQITRTQKSLIIVSNWNKPKERKWIFQKYYKDEVAVVESFSIPLSAKLHSEYYLVHTHKTAAQ